MLTASGIDFHPTDPSPYLVRIEDIAHALAHTCRYGGHTSSFYSVAQHSVLISRALPPDLRLWGLLHDAAEAYVGDIPRPLKGHLQGYDGIEGRVMQAIVLAFNLQPSTMPPEVKAIDDAIIADEAKALMPRAARDWPGAELALGIEIEPWAPGYARAVFLYEYTKLTTMIPGKPGVGLTAAQAKALGPLRGGNSLVEALWKVRADMLSRLLDLGLVERHDKTLCRITDKGRAALADYANQN